LECVLIIVIIVDPLKILRRGAWITILNLALADFIGGEDEVPGTEDEVPGTEDKVPEAEDKVPGTEDEVPDFSGGEDEVPGAEDKVPEVPGGDVKISKMAVKKLSLGQN
jgi:hypothetical protein